MHIAVLLIAAATLGLVAHATQFQPPDVFLHSIAQPRYIPKQEKYAGLAIWESLSDDDDDVDRPDMTQQRADMMVEFAESYGKIQCSPGEFVNHMLIPLEQGQAIK